MTQRRMRRVSPLSDLETYKSLTEHMTQTLMLQDMLVKQQEKEIERLTRIIAAMKAAEGWVSARGPETADILNVTLVAGATDAPGASQGYRGLPFTRSVYDDVYYCQSAWVPTQEQAARIAAGAPLILSVESTQQPPVVLSVGSWVEPEVQK